MSYNKCNLPCRDYPECPCVPDINKYYRQVELEDQEFERNTCEGCGGEFGECYCDDHHEDDDFDCGQILSGICMKAGSEDCEFECPYNNHK